MRSCSPVRSVLTMDRIRRYRAMVPSLPTIPTRGYRAVFHRGSITREGRPIQQALYVRLGFLTLARDLRWLYVFLLDKILQAPDPAILTVQPESISRRDLNPDPDARNKFQ